MSKLKDAWDTMQRSENPWRYNFHMEAAITEAEETIARLTRERDEARAEAKQWQDTAQSSTVRAEALEDYVERNDYIGGWRAKAEKAERERDEALCRVEHMSAALARLRDCDWVISLPDRMDAVRNIARAALKGGAE